MNRNNTLKLSKRERDILAVAYHRAALPITELAKLLGMRTHSVRRTLQRLEESGVIAKKAFVDVYRLGYSQFELFYAIAAANRRAASAFLRTLSASKQVAWIGEYSGEFQYVFTVCCKNSQELLKFIEETTNHPEVSVVSRQMAVRARYTEFPLRNLADKVQRDIPLSFGEQGSVRIDETDNRILSALSENAGVSSRAIGKELALSQTAVVHRIRRLEENGIIPGYTYVVDFSRIGLQAYSIILRTKSHTSRLTKKLTDFAMKSRSVSYMVESVGAYDYKLGVLLEDPSGILMLAQEITEVFAEDLASLTTLTAFDYRKVSRYPF